MARPPRYNGLADWYDQVIGELGLTATATTTLARLAGPGPGACLDLGCGTGIAVPALAEGGWRVVGVDLSRDQLRVAQARAGPLGARLVAADAAVLPFADRSFDLVVSVLTHTDFDNPEAAFAEAARVLRPGGRFVYVGVHPCFVAPFVERRPTGPLLLHPGYRNRGWRPGAPGLIPLPGRCAPPPPGRPGRSRPRPRPHPHPPGRARRRRLPGPHRPPTASLIPLEGPTAARAAGCARVSQVWDWAVMVSPVLGSGSQTRRRKHTLGKDTC